MVASVVVLGFVGAVIASVAAGVPADSLPGVALGSEVLLLAERTAALFATWMLIAVVVIRALKDELPVEMSGRGVRYAEVGNVQAKAACTDDVLRGIEADMRWLRKMVVGNTEDERGDRRDDER
jgi:hypothetical protein